MLHNTQGAPTGYSSRNRLVFSVRAGFAGAEKLERVAKVPESVLARDFSFGVANGAGDVDEQNESAFLADEVVVVLPGITQFVIAARAPQVHLVHEMELLHELNSAENRCVIRTRSSARR